MIGVPHVGGLPGYWVDSLEGMEKPKEGYWFQRAEGMPVDMARNTLVAGGLAAGCDWLLQIDADMEWSKFALQRVWQTAEATGADMVGALTFTRYMPPVPCVFRGVTRRIEGRDYLRIQAEETREWLKAHEEAQGPGPFVLDPAPADAVVEADATGGAFLLAHRRVFEAMERKWGRGRKARKERELFGGPWFRRDGMKKGEDFQFFARARALGFRLVIDRSVCVRHMHGSSGGVGPEEFLAWQEVKPFETWLDT